MKRKDVEEKLHAAILDYAEKDGFEKSKDYVCTKYFNDSVRWCVGGYLSDVKPPYANFSTISCEYIDASIEINSFFKKNGIDESAKYTVGFGSKLEVYTKEKTVLRVSSENIDQVAFEVYLRVKEGVEKYLLPRVDQGAVVDEYLTKPPHQWPSAALLQCCLTIVSYGLVTDDSKLVKAGVDRTFEILNRPNYNQLHRNIFESLRSVVLKNF